MKASYNEYFEQLHDKLNSRYVNGFSVSNFLSDISKDKLILTGLDRYSYDESIDYPWLDELEVVIEKIRAIASSPRSHLKVYKEVKKSEQAVKVNNTDINMTAQVNKFWVDLNGNLFPEKIFNDAFETELAIYENRFIVALVDKILIFLSKTTSRLFDMIRTVNKNFINGNVSLDNTKDVKDLSTLPLFSKGGKRVYDLYQPLLTTTESPYIDTLKRVIAIRKDLSHVLMTPFYKVVKKARPLSDNDVHPTNLLIGDKTYAPCFLFYKKLSLLMSETAPKDNRNNSATYCDYVILNILLAVKELGYSFEAKDIAFENKHLKINSLVVKKEYITIQVIQDKHNLDLIVKNVKTDNSVNPEIFTSKVRVNICMDVTNLYPSSEELKAYFTKLNQSFINKGYSNSFAVTANSDIADDNVIICSPYFYKVGANIKNMIESTIIFTEGSKYIYSNLCPVCGFYVDGEGEDGNCHCTNCESIYSIFARGTKENRKEIIWIKKLANPNKAM